MGMGGMGGGMGGMGGGMGGGWAVVWAAWAVAWAAWAVAWGRHGRWHDGRRIWAAAGTMPATMGMMMLARLIMTSSATTIAGNQPSLMIGMMGGMGGMGGGMGMGMPSCPRLGCRSQRSTPISRGSLPTRLVSLGEGPLAMPEKGEKLQVGDISDVNRDPRVQKSPPGSPKTRLPSAWRNWSCGTSRASSIGCKSQSFRKAGPMPTSGHWRGGSSSSSMSCRPATAADFTWNSSPRVQSRRGSPTP